LTEEKFSWLERDTFYRQRSLTERGRWLPRAPLNNRQAKTLYMIYTPNFAYQKNAGVCFEIAVFLFQKQIDTQKNQALLKVAKKGKLTPPIKIFSCCLKHLYDRKSCHK
jgi:hypothetical protein